jgi:hypothetical protein
MKIPNPPNQEEEEETEMANPIFNALGRNMPMGNNNMLAQFNNFVKQMQGKNPHEEINRLLQSGAISQQQLNEAQQMAQQFQSMFRQ